MRYGLYQFQRLNPDSFPTPPANPTFHVADEDAQPSPDQRRKLMLCRRQGSPGFGLFIAVPAFKDRELYGSSNPTRFLCAECLERLILALGNATEGMQP